MFFSTNQLNKALTKKGVAKKHKEHANRAPTPRKEAAGVYNVCDIMFSHYSKRRAFICVNL